MSDYPDPARAGFCRFRSYQTRWRDNDVYGHMNNAVYYEYFDSMVNHWLIDSEALEIPDGPVVGLVAETGCRFIASVGYPDLLEVGLVAMHVGRTSVVYGLGMFAQNAPNAVAICRFVHVYVDSVTRKPVELPQKMRSALSGITIEGRNGAANT